MPDPIAAVLKHWKPYSAMLMLGITVGGGLALGGREYVDAPKVLASHIEQADSVHTRQDARIDDAHREHREVIGRLDRLVCELVRERTGEWPAECPDNRILP